MPQTFEKNMKTTNVAVMAMALFVPSLGFCQASDFVARAVEAAPPVATTATANGFGYSLTDAEVAAAPEAPFENALSAYNLFVGSTSSPGSRSLIIPKDSPDPKSIAETEEDLSVMTRILEKAITSRDEKNHRAMGIDIHGAVYGGSSSPRNLYLEGYGAVFFMSVDFPIVPPATKQNEADVKETTSSEWEEARREVFRPSTGLLPGMAVTSEPAGPEYDADKVEDFKQDLISALKNGSHIRRLKSDETVTIVVTGRPGAWVMSRPARRGGVYSSTQWTPRPRTGGQSTRMVLRARKADMDSFQKDKISAEEFRKKVSIIVY